MQQKSSQQVPQSSQNSISQDIKTLLFEKQREEYMLRQQRRQPGVDIQHIPDKT